MMKRPSYAAQTGRFMRRFCRDESGATLVEFALALTIMLLLFFGLIDFARLGYHVITAEKAMHIAARVASVRPSACGDLPLVNNRGVSTVSPLPRFGTSCSAGAGFCADPGTLTCTGDAGNATANEIWGLVGQGMLPNTTIANLRFKYSFDPNLGFLGGPYVPLVTVKLEDTVFSFVSPLGQLVRLTGATPNAGLGADINFPSTSVSLPGEDLANGTNG